MLEPAGITQHAKCYPEVNVKSNLKKNYNKYVIYIINFGSNEDLCIFLGRGFCILL